MISGLTANGPRPLVGKRALVTGGASGIGAATVVLLAQLGADVAVIDRDPDGAAAVVDRAKAEGVRAHFLDLDVSRTDRIAATVARAIELLGSIDILVNCAATNGRPAPLTLLELSQEVWTTLYTVNVTAPFLFMQHVGRHMVARGVGGRIVNVGSSAAHRAASSPAYGSSKAALTQLGRSAAAELAPYDINVNTVAPGSTRTPFSGKGEEESERAVREGPNANLFKRISEPEDIAATIGFLCLRESRQITAQTVHVSAGAVV
jgi:NAD(P)-dependent dehydrogenase (short-subunit alcohol dehydrogenase family)